MSTCEVLVIKATSPLMALAGQFNREPCGKPAEGLFRGSCPEGHVRDKWVCELCKVIPSNCGICIQNGTSYSPMELQRLE